MPDESRTADNVVCNGSLLRNSLVVHESGDEDIAQHAFPLIDLVFLNWMNWLFHFQQTKLYSSIEIFGGELCMICMSRKSFNARSTNWKLVINRILWVGNYRHCYYCYWECGLGSTATDGSKMQCRLRWEILHLRFRFRFVGNESDKFPEGFRRTAIVVSAYSKSVRSGKSYWTHGHMS